MAGVALVIGVALYEDGSELPATTADSEAIAKLLQFHADGSKNMSVALCNRNTGGISKEIVENEIQQTLASATAQVVIYFSGHGQLSPGGAAGQIMVSNGSIDMRWLMDLVKKYNHTNRSTVLILDCCHAGAMGLADTVNVPSVELDRGVTILAACDTVQKASEHEYYGRFTRLLVDGLRGGSADLSGRVTPASLYSHIDQAIGSKGQRPVFATNIHRSTVIRECAAPISVELLRSIKDRFTHADSQLQLDPAFEPDRGEAFNKPISNSPDALLLKDVEVDPEKTKIFSDLQNMVRVGLVKPKMAEEDPLDKNHMFWAAVYSRKCELTELGKHYWRLAKQDEI